MSVKDGPDCYLNKDITVNIEEIILNIFTIVLFDFYNLFVRIQT